MKKVIPLHSKIDNEQLQTTNPAASLSTSEAIAEQPGRWNEGAEQQLLLMQRVIGNNSVESIISIFFSWCADLGLAEGMTYETLGEVDDIHLGNRRHHSANYTLVLDKTDLGRVSLCRRERFSESELLTIEQALGIIARCLRTAIDYQTLEALVTQDPLTGFGNRLSLKTWIEREMSRTRRHNSPLSLMMIDIDHFKKINDTLGHLGGDHILRAIANAFKKSMRGSDLLFRYGGDEFTILLPHTDAEGAHEAAKQIRENLKSITNEEFGLDDADDALRPDVSIGIAGYQAGDTENTLLQRADTHLYHAKANGRGAVCSNV